MTEIINFYVKIGGPIIDLSHKISLKEVVGILILKFEMRNYKNSLFFSILPSTNLRCLED